MEKETSCINSMAILDYLKSNRIECSDIIRGLDPEIDALDDPEGFLRNPDNWISSSVVSKLFERSVQLLNDDQTAYKIGRYVIENNKLGLFQQVFVKAFWSIKKALKHSQKINDQWNRSKKIELRELKRNEATVRLHWTPGMKTSKHICQYNQGVYTYIPLIWGGNRLTLDEKCCYFDGSDYCEYHLKWPLRNRFQEIVSRFHTSQSVLMETLREIEKDKKTIEKNNEDLKSINKELQDKFVELEQVKAALEKSYNIINRSPAVAFLWRNEEGWPVEYVSNNVQEIFGYTVEDFKSGKITYADIIHPDDLKRVSGEVDTYSKERIREDFTHIPYRIITKDGKEKWIDDRTYIQRNHQGIVTNYQGAVLDITERRILEAQLHQAQKMEAIGKLAGGIAHDFNNILGIILGNIELAIYDVPTWNPARMNLEEIKTASLRAKDVVRQLLSFARKTNLEKKPINIIPIVEESLKLLRSSIPTSIEFHQNLPENVDTVLADPTQINQVLINLCTNAAHAMPNGGIIEVILKNAELDQDAAARHPELQPGCYVNLVVGDTGHGISQEVIDRIFDPYFTTKEIGKGTGLGLAVVHGIVESHGGAILVESTLGKGTTFSIFFPAVQAVVADEIKPVKVHPTGNERILFVDDEESLLKLGRQTLERLGYLVETEMNPMEAFNIFKSKPDHFDLIITDLTMPKMTGDRLIKEVLTIRPDISTILCTGFSERIAEKKAREIGASAYLEKPLILSDLANTIRKVLDGKIE